MILHTLCQQPQVDLLRSPACRCTSQCFDLSLLRFMLSGAPSLPCRGCQLIRRRRPGRHGLRCCRRTLLRASGSSCRGCGSTWPSAAPLQQHRLHRQQHLSLLHSPLVSAPLLRQRCLLLLHCPLVGACLQTQHWCLSVLHSPLVCAGTSGKASRPALPLLRQQCRGCPSTETLSVTFSCLSAWVRQQGHCLVHAACSMPDCQYLHDVGALSVTLQVSCLCAGLATRARAAALASAARQAAHMRPLVLDYLQTGRMPDTDAVPGTFLRLAQAVRHDLHQHVIGICSKSPDNCCKSPPCLQGSSTRQIRPGHKSCLAPF